MIKRLLYLFVFLTSMCIVSVFSEDVDEVYTYQELPIIQDDYAIYSINKAWAITDHLLPWDSLDYNGDGYDDYAIKKVEGQQIKEFEVMDMNFDGFVDDFAYYDKNGKLDFQEIDTNYDKKIDLWIDVVNGNRILSIQQDMNFDGIVDLARFY